MTILGKIGKMNLNKQKLKINIQRTTIVLLVVLFSFSSVAFAVESYDGQLSTPSTSVDLFSFPYTTEDIGNRTLLTTVDVTPEPYWTWNITSPSAYSGWHYTPDSSMFDILGVTPTGRFLCTGYFWPVYQKIDIRGLYDYFDNESYAATVRAQYSCDFDLTIYGDDGTTGTVYCSLVPRFRLLNAAGNQLQFVVDESYWNEVPTNNSETVNVPVNGVQNITYVDTDWKNYAYIEIKWQFNIRIEDIASDVGISFRINHADIDFSFEHPRELTPDEELDDAIKDVDDKLSNAGDAFNSVPQPSDKDIGNIIKPVDEIVDSGWLNEFSGIAGFITGTTLISGYLTVTIMVVLVSYVLFGKKK